MPVPHGGSASIIGAGRTVILAEHQPLDNHKVHVDDIGKCYGIVNRVWDQNTELLDI